jgi:hypothetical protein
MPKLFAALLAAALAAPLLSTARLEAQTVSLSDPLTIRNDYGYELIGRIRDHILLFRDKYDDFEVQAFDRQMRLSWNKPLEDIGRRGVQILAVVGSKNDFSVLFKARRRGTTMLCLHKYDSGANLIDSVTIKNYGERVFAPPALDLVISEDRNCVAVFNTAEKGTMEIVCLRLDKMQVIWDKIVQFEQDYYETTLKSLVLSNDAHFFLVSEYNNRRGKLDEHAFRILEIHVAGDQLRTAPLKELLTGDVKFVFDNQHGQLVGAGLYGDKSRDRINGFFYLRFPQNEPPVLRYEPFADQFLSVLRRKDLEQENIRGINDADVIQLALRQDGGALLIAERHHEIVRGTGGGRGFLRDGMRMIVDYYFDDLFVVAINPDGSLHWHTVLHKKQYSQDDEAIFSSFFLLKSPDRLHFMFNDEIKYENTCSEYVLNPIGEFDRNSLLSTVNQGLRLRFRDAIQISATECLAPSEFRNRLRLVLIRS